MKRFVLAIVLSAVLGFANIANANTLQNNGGGLIYDPNLGITWFDFSYFGQWSDSMAWAAGLTVANTVAGSWSLPSIGQMGELYYTQLGLAFGTPVSQSNQSPFTYLYPEWYWSGTGDNFFALDFNFYNGDHYSGAVGGRSSAMAVHSGNVLAPTATTEPVTILLLGLGLVWLAGIRRKF